MPRAAASAAKPKAPRKPRAPKAHQLAPPLPAGEVLEDFTKKQKWKVGQSIGSGGFGLLYLVDKDRPGPIGPNADYVLKIEPHGNGPLFCELHFYQRVAKPDLIKQWMSSQKLKNLGMPKYIASGSHEKASTKYRFMIMERFGTDLQKVFESNRKRFSRKTVLNLGIKIIDALEYIHDKDYAHADIKASNLLMGYAKGTQDQVYLVDFGLAFRYTNDGKHKEYKEDPKRAHDGTIEFTSRDAHNGVAPSRRADLEILGYCLLQWLCGELPWENKLTDKDYVKDQKMKYMSNIPELMRKCFPSGNKPDEIEKYLSYVANLGYTDIPDYDKLRQLFRASLKKLGYKDDGKLELTCVDDRITAAAETPSKKRSADDIDSPVQKRPASKPRARKAIASVPERDSSEDEPEDDDDMDCAPTPKKSRSAVTSPKSRVKSPAKAVSNGVTAKPTKNSKPAQNTPGASSRKKRSKKVKPTETIATQTTPGLRTRSQKK